MATTGFYENLRMLEITSSMVDQKYQEHNVEVEGNTENMLLCMVDIEGGWGYQYEYNDVVTTENV